MNNAYLQCVMLITIKKIDELVHWVVLRSTTQDERDSAINEVIIGCWALTTAPPPYFSLLLTTYQSCCTTPISVPPPPFLTFVLSVDGHWNALLYRQKRFDARTVFGWLV